MKGNFKPSLWVSLAWAVHCCEPMWTSWFPNVKDLPQPSLKSINSIVNLSGCLCSFSGYIFAAGVQNLLGIWGKGLTQTLKNSFFFGRFCFLRSFKSKLIREFLVLWHTWAQIVFWDVAWVTKIQWTEEGQRVKTRTQTQSGRLCHISSWRRFSYPWHYLRHLPENAVLVCPGSNSAAKLGTWWGVDELWIRDQVGLRWARGQTKAEWLQKGKLPVGLVQLILRAALIPEGCNGWSGCTQPAKGFGPKSHWEQNKTEEQSPSWKLIEDPLVRKVIMTFWKELVPFIYI